MAVSSVGFAQKNKVQIPEMPMDDDSGLISYSNKASVNGVIAADLYDRAYNWKYHEHE